jgi:hypothetical protein
MKNNGVEPYRGTRSFIVPLSIEEFQYRCEVVRENRKRLREKQQNEQEQYRKKRARLYAQGLIPQVQYSERGVPRTVWVRDADAVGHVDLLKTKQ